VLSRQRSRRQTGRSLAGKVILVTGAGSGIGRAVAIRVAQLGAKVGALGRRRGRLAATSRSCVTAGGDAIALVANVASFDDVLSAAEELESHFGRLDGLVNNAGIARFGDLSKASDDDIDEMMNVNIRGPLNVIRACLPSLKRSRGVIVNVTSVAGVLPSPHRAVYGATKAALNHLTRSLARELAPSIRVNAIVPGPIATGIYNRCGLTRAGSHALRRRMIATTPLGRFGHPSEIAAWIAHLLSSDGSWVTGALLQVDGGRAT
jgi:NAD(P)-dependent dehydrogenase (short-subunit alcohol dehydrogenase family)